MDVLIVGGGGREHALALAARRSPRLGRLYAAPGNAGIAEIAECADIGADDIEGLTALAKEKSVGLVIVGPEAPLAAGLADRLEAEGIKVFGPSAAAAELEASKAFMKKICGDCGAPSADWEVFDEPEAAKEHIRVRGAPIVVKADGLAAGKGVFVCRTLNEAFAAVDHCLTESAFGAAGDTVVVEEFLSGPELSFFALADGETVAPFGSAQDHKTAHDGDSGPNTGGMGAYSPAPAMTAALESEVMETVIRPVVRGMARAGRPYKGVLFAGLMLTQDGPKLLEFNVRFGDPECQVILARLESDFLDVLEACVDGRLNETKIRFGAEHAMAVVMAAKGYPGNYAKGEPIGGLDAAAAAGAAVLHAGTRAGAGGEIVSDGGRVLNITGAGPTLRAARDRAYAGVEAVDWPGGFWRTDIGWRALSGDGEK
ncbi:MAG: phosphoribosylamine--glycine ligase [Rhodospirillales bacterium]